jgi:undecaprenyl pyrophosphate phosphatase UppP
LALLPIMALMFMTARMIWARRSELLCTPILLGTVVATVYSLLIENMLKVGLRQPYPGIVGFFIWGLLLARLSALEELAPKPADEIS